MPPVALILRTAGTNCDLELAHAFELAGASSQTVHINSLIENPKPLDQCDIIGLPGGFSYGDDIAAGKIFAHKIRYKLLEPLLAAIDRKVPVIAPCNGFQILVKLGILPGDSQTGNPAPNSRIRYQQTASLVDNEKGRFIDRWVTVKANRDSPCIWTKRLNRFDLPIAHGQGRFVAQHETLQKLQNSGQIALRYVDENPNGSIDNIAGICDETGLVLGLMPHPERAVSLTNSPTWGRNNTADKQTTAGLQMFINAVKYVNSGSAIAA